MKARVIKDNKEIDSSETEFGIRSITISPEEGLKLNGRPIKLKGGCIHHDHGILGSKSYDRAEERKVEILKNNGFNAVRLAHNPYAPSFLTYCDRLGLLVIEEFFDVWTCGKKSYDYHLYFEKYWEEDIENTIKRDFNHPSIIMWSIGNEVTWGSGIDWEREEGYSSIYEWSDKLAKKVKELDPTRLVTSAFCGLAFESINVEDREDDNIVLLGIWKGNEETKERWGEITKRFFRHLDVAGYNYKIERYAYDRIKYKDRIICGTETFPYTMYDNWKETLENPNVIGDFVWTAIDYLGEAGIGRVSIDREEANNFLGKYPWFLANCGDIDICGEKRPQSYYRDIVWGSRKDPIIFALPPELYGKKLYMRAWSWEPVERSYNFKGYEEKPIRIYIYANADEVELFLNGKSLGRKISGEKVKFKTTYDITYEPGILEVIAYKDGKEVGKDRLETTSDPYELKIIPDRKDLLSYGDLCYLKIIAVDEKGLIVPDADNKIVVEVKGDGKLIALGNSDPFFEGSLVSPFGKLYKGKALAVIKSIKDEGEIYIKVSGDMLKSSEEKIYIKRDIP
jgi:beta-galactosidase